MLVEFCRSTEDFNHLTEMTRNRIILQVIITKNVLSEANFPLTDRLQTNIWSEIHYYCYYEYRRVLASLKANKLLF